MDCGSGGDDVAGEQLRAERKNKPRLRYRREELLALQTESWTGILGDIEEELRVVEREQAVTSSRNRNVDRRQRTTQHTTAPGVIWCWKKESGNDLGYEAVAAGSTFDENQADPGQLEVEIVEEDAAYADSDSEVESFQPRAFVVEGEPDFESGPPQDGLEYLRRVRYEAALYPKVKVARIDPKKFAGAQTQYMPVIPPVQSCAPEVLPLLEWETEFLADFSELRLRMADTRVPADAAKINLPSVRNKAAWQAFCFGTEPDSSRSEDAPLLVDEGEESTVGVTLEDGLGGVECLCVGTVPANTRSEDELQLVDNGCLEDSISSQEVHRDFGGYLHKGSSESREPCVTSVLASKHEGNMGDGLGNQVTDQMPMKEEGMRDPEIQTPDGAAANGGDGEELEGSCVSDMKPESKTEILSGLVAKQPRPPQLPHLAVMLLLDEVSRAALLRDHVAWLERVTGLPPNRALWLFSLAAVVDKPLDADTSAAFRALFRRCAELRASKTIQDDELVMLNILITIAGRYFGQAEELLSI